MNRIKATLPNILTLINLSMGMLAILFAVSSSTDAGRMIPASLLVLVAAFTDRYDGKIARKLNVDSELGKQLDSLSDLISFGVAPSIIAWKVSFIPLGFFGYILALVFPIAGAYRLARYNVTTFDEFFRGLPITIAGAFLSMINLYYAYVEINRKLTCIHIAIAVVIVLLLSWLMVSKFKLKKI